MKHAYSPFIWNTLKRPAQKVDFQSLETARSILPLKSYLLESCSVSQNTSDRVAIPVCSAFFPAFAFKN